MTVNDEDLWTRKDIARLLGPHVNEKMVGRNEKRWGLQHARARLKTRCVLYAPKRVLLILRAAGAVE